MPFHPRNVSRSVLILHGREEDDLADVVLLAKKHAEAVNAAADAACRRHAVIQGVDEAKVDVGGFLISPFPGGELGVEAFLLVEGIVELAVGVAHLSSADEELEPLDEARVFAPLCQRGDLDGVGMDEGRLDEALLDEFVEEGVHDVANAVPGFLQGDVMLFG